MKVRKRSIEAEAFQIPNPDIEKDLIAFLAWAEEVDFIDWDSGDGDEIIIETLEGPMTAPMGAWVIKGVEGEFWAVKESTDEKETSG